MKEIEIILERCPFLTLGKFNDEHILGILQNSTNTTTAIYVYELIPKELRGEFLKHGETWWWESNRQVSISIFLPQEMRKFKPYLKFYPRDSWEFVKGPSMSMSDRLNKRVKKKQINLKDLKNEAAICSAQKSSSY